jgi:cysteine desulfurase
MVGTGVPVYLDCAASSPPDPRVVELMVRHLTTDFGNPGSFTHQYGVTSRKAVERARDQIAAAAAVRRSEVFFTSGATEANNLAILGVAQGNAVPGHMVSTQIEHPSVLEPLRILESRGWQITRVAPSPQGWVRAEDVVGAVRADTRLISVMHVNNETGVQQPIDEIASAMSGSSAILQVDASQSFGKIFEPLRHPRIDLMSVSGHKMGGPQGVGALLVRKRVRGEIKPLLFGGGQEGGLRPGTLPAHLIAGFGLAAELAALEIAERTAAAVEFQRQVLERLQPADFVLHGDQARLSPYILNLGFPGLDNQQVTEAWAGLAAVSNGSACTSQQQHCSHVLHAMGIGDEQAASAIRLSWSHRTELPDFDAMIEALQQLPRENHGRTS